MYMNAERIPNNIFGIQTEIAGGIEPFSANVLKSVKNRIKINDRRKPMAICGPVPPRLFREETIAPMKTRIRMVKGDV